MSLANVTLGRRMVAEALGTAMLLATVVGSGVMAERLAEGNGAVALLANAVATGAGLVALILTFGPISGAHFNPVVTVMEASRAGQPWREVPLYLGAQVGGAVVGVFWAQLMFGEPYLELSTRVRSGTELLFAEAIATFGLLGIIWSSSRARAESVPFAVGAYITAAYWFTASTSFANPAATVARALTNTFTGIRPMDVGGFVVAQSVGAAAAILLFRWLMPPAVRAAAPVGVSSASTKPGEAA